MATFSLRWRFIYKFRLDGEIFRLDGEIFGGKTSLATSRARVEAELSEAESIPKLCRHYRGTSLIRNRGTNLR